MVKTGSGDEYPYSQIMGRARAQANEHSGFTAVFGNLRGVDAPARAQRDLDERMQNAAVLAKWI
jgi:hypothetical protein